MPIPPDPTPTGPGPHARAAAGKSAAGLTPASLLLKLKLLQEHMNELQQQLSELVDEVAKSNSPPKP